MTWNDESRMATIQSLVESGSFVIDRSSFITTGDKVFIDGHFYSDKPPAPALLGAAVYAPLYMAGLRLHEGNSIAYFLITLLTVGTCWLFGTLAFFYALRFTGMDAEHGLLAGVALGLGTIFLTWSTTFNNHEFAAGFLAIGFLFLLKARYEQRVQQNLAIAGLFLSLAGAADIPAGVFYMLFLLNVLRDPALRKAAGFYLAPLLLTIAPTLAINYMIHGSVMPVQIYRSYFDYPGSPWLGSPDLSGMSTNEWRFALLYGLQTLIGPRGFLLYNPLLFVSIWGLAREIRRKGTFFYEALCVAAGSCAVLLYYWRMTTNYGGWSYSIRWFVPLIPLLLFFFYPYLQHLNAKRPAFKALLGVSVVIAFVGALNPWSPITYSEISFVANIKQFVEHLRHPVSMRPQ